MVLFTARDAVAGVRADLAFPALTSVRKELVCKLHKNPCWSGIPHGGVARRIRRLQRVHKVATMLNVATRPDNLTKEALEGSDSAASKFSWLRQWYPVIPLKYLDPARPTQVTLLNQNFAVWRTREGEWVAVEDRCPHRLSPLSEGRISAQGELMCSYHGWTFDKEGKCTNIPQLAPEDPRTQAALDNPRSCATAFPTVSAHGLLFLWPDPSPHRFLDCTQQPPYTNPDVPEDADIDWVMNEVQNDYAYWMEQTMDPAHAMFLHHNGQMFRMSDSVAMEADPVDRRALHEGFTFHHRGYNKNNKDMVAIREFHPPCGVRVKYESPSSLQYFMVYNVPVKPGVTRVFFYVTFQSKQSKVVNNILQLVLRSFNHSLVPQPTILDQDTVILHGQEVNGSQGAQPYDPTYFLPAPADYAVTAARRWLVEADYEGMWKEQGGGAGLRQEALPLEKLMDRYERHTKHCVQCQKSSCRWAQFSRLSAWGAVVSAFGMAYLIDHQGLLAQETMTVGVVALVLGTLSLKAEEIRRGYFSSFSNWLEAGGLSLVPRR